MDIKKCEDIVEIYSNNKINTDATIRWEKGIDHHPKSKELMEHIAALDFLEMNDYFCFKTG